jgi:hypothetical protein
MKWIERVGKSNGRITQGRLYQYNPETNTIRDDNGHQMRPRLEAKNYWREVEAPFTFSDWSKRTDEYAKHILQGGRIGVDPFVISSKEMGEQANFWPAYRPGMGSSLTNTLEQSNMTTVESKKNALTIETRPFVNGNQVDESAVLRYIKAEQEKIEDLEKLGLNSKTPIQSRIDKAKENIEELLALLEDIDKKNKE